MAVHRKVERSDSFIEEAMALFPPGGSTDGRPSYELFEETVLLAAETAFSLNFEGLQPVEPGSPVRYVLTAEALFFPRSLIFYGILSSFEMVEIVGIEQEDQWPEDCMDDT
jgi:hypothetical protein